MSNNLQRYSDKIGDIITEQTDSEKSTFNQLLIESDNYAIAFQYWLLENCTNYLKIWTYLKDDSRIYTMKELINIFKKEYLIINQS